jgi:Co/Zn/Cd efflux system component
MSLEGSHPDSQMSLLSVVIVETLSGIGLAVFDPGGSIFFKCGIGLLSALLISVCTSDYFSKLIMSPSLTSKEGPSQDFRSLMSLKSRQLLRLGFAAFFTMVSFVMFLYSKGTSVATDVMVFSIARYTVAIFGGAVKSTKLGRFICFFFLCSGVLVTAVTSNMRLIFLMISGISLWLSVRYIRLLSGALHNDSTAVASILLISGLLSLLVGIFVHGFRFHLQFVPCFIGGIFALSPAMFLALIRKSPGGASIAAVHTVLPAAIAAFITIVKGNGSEIPLSLYFSVIICLIGAHFLPFSFTEGLVIKPFSNNRSIFHFFMTSCVFCGILFQYVLGCIYGQLWRFVDAVYFIVMLKWTLSEVIGTIQKGSSIQFSYGYGRFSNLVTFSIAIVSVFSLFFILTSFFNGGKSTNVNFVSVIPSVLVHGLLVVFFIWSPRTHAKRRVRSMSNAIHFSDASKMDNSATTEFEFVDILSLLVAVCGGVTGGFIIDRLLALVLCAFVLYLMLPMALESLSVLMQDVPEKLFPQSQMIETELMQCDFVKEVLRFNVWKNDQNLTVGTIQVRIDDRTLTKPQDFLMHVIGLCQQAGILDVTVEIIAGNGDPVLAERSFFMPYMRKTPSPM